MIHNILKRLRLEKGISQSELSRRTGIPQRYISRWESGHGRPRWEDYVLFSIAFEVSLDEMEHMCEQEGLT